MTLNLLAINKRYVENPCIDNPLILANNVTQEWIKHKTNKLVEFLTQRNLDLEECNEVGGIAYAILQGIKKFGATDLANLDICIKLLNFHTPIKQNIHKSCASRYLTGTIGLITIQGLCFYYAQKSLDEISNQFKQLLPTILTPGYQKIGDDEILNGRAGFLAGVLLLRNETKFEILSKNEIREVLSAIIQSGRAYSIRKKSNAKLMFEWHGKEYLGAAHGVSGIYQILLSYWDFLSELEKTDLRQSIDWYLTLQSTEGNFPSSNEDRGDNELLHWCHGAPGVIHMLINAFLVLKEKKFIESAKKCADIIWKKGILRKGPGICHGVAGNGYAFLLMYKVTLDETYLIKAKAFAFIMLSSEFQALSRVPDSPYSLFEGWAGALCFLIDLYAPNEAQFPMLPLAFYQ